ncbi:ABC transporter ATP-binding protein [Synergistaceae bacterium OttesenSCG-928-D05]|nr:ABC transporter ATP-binding protein [Synergistaceae bacterium OttesenSCG-928-D05]
MSVTIDIDNVVKKYGDLTVVNGLSLKVDPGEFFTLLGPSGCGKTTLLRMIIGFNSIEAGEIRVDGRVVNDVPTDKRNMGMVFQNYAIFPHMTVYENVAFGLKMRKLSNAEIAPRVAEILELVKIDALRDRKPTELSGGQQQRVALARAIVIQPEVLLMDEPLSNLDAKLRVEMRNVIKNIQHKLGITTVYVTHDQEEALAVSDRLAVMNAGVIQQIDTPQRVYQRPANLFVSTFIGLSNVLNGKITGDGKGVDFGGYMVEMDNLNELAKPNAPVLVSVRPEEFVIDRAAGEGLKAVVKNRVFLGSTIHYFLEMGDKELEVIDRADNLEMIPAGAQVTLTAKANKINVFDESGGRSLIAAERTQ